MVQYIIKLEGGFVMENELKELMLYMKENKQKLENLLQERKQALNKKNEIDDKSSVFYKEAELNYNDKVKEYDSLAKITNDYINSKKKEIVDKLNEEMKKVEEISDQ